MKDGFEEFSGLLLTVIGDLLLAIENFREENVL